MTQKMLGGEGLLLGERVVDERFLAPVEAQEELDELCPMTRPQSALRPGGSRTPPGC